MADDPYRSETEQLRRRVSELEHELTEARETIRSLSGEGPEKASIATALLGGPLEIALESSVEGELPQTSHEDIHDIVRARLGAIGQASSIGKTFNWTLVNPQTARSFELSVRARNGRTTVRIQERLGGLAGGLFGGVVGGVGAGGLGGVIPALIFLHVPAALIVLASLLWILLVYAIVRVGYGATVRARRRSHELLARELHDHCQARIAEPARSSLRVAEARASDDDGEAGAEQEADVAIRPSRKAR